ncbi:hypothetical protein DFR29_1318 [Tahibacter aquaticus]|uniref:Uncharacterized protein n=1 Tax=Tahibacter aquaticus TaxID=520092 RepID=A0A4R6YI16_9GAMM|nr:hypothetical protein [Tahibacter aquaticus]TDR36264.1 hypothetical protein DFR29_1318 [Tahibacter aquaticus]
MSESSEPTGEALPTTQARRVAFESLRERTDELELIISGISLLALLSLPGWLLEHWTRLELHAEGQRLQLLSLAFQLGSGLSSTLACAFLLHLGVRAYWVGLIGLKASFPAGIRWQSIRSIGPITAAYHRRTAPDLDASIDAADRVASIVFALVSLVALSMLWIGGLLAALTTLVIVTAQLLGFGEQAVGQFGLYAFLFLTLIALLPVLLLDSPWASRFLPPGPPSVWRRRAVEMAIRFQAMVFPVRLAMPVQLSLESNLPRWTFTVVFLALIFASAALGSLQVRVARQFAVISSYDYFTDSDADAGLRSAHYESLRSERDVLARVPLIPADQVADGHLRVFLPYLPSRDNPVLRQRCAAAADRAQRQACLAALWQASLDDTPVDLAGFVLAERRDLGQRGLQGYLSLNGLAPGQHELRLRWNAAAATTATTASTAGAATTADYRIPFWFSPPFQQDLAPPPG